MNKYFIYAGNAYPHKNLNRLIEAAVSLNRYLEEKAILKIVSARNIFIKRLETEIRRRKAENLVELLGFVADEELLKLYKNSVAFVFPSFSEGFGIPGIEAMEAGTLILASDIPVFREVYKDAAIYFNPYDFSSIEKSMRDALAMSLEEREQKILFAQKFVKRYSWQKMAKETLEIYQSFK